MPVFEYTGYRNPYGPSIAEALQHQADPQAAAALRSGDIAARAAEQQGALRAQQFSALGAIPGEIQAQQDRALARQRAAQQQQIGAQQLQQGALSLEDAQAQRAADAQLSKLFAAAPRGSDGTYDMRAFLGTVPPELTKYAQKWVQQGNAINDSWIADDTRRRGQMQQGALTLAQAGAPFQATLALIDSAHRDHVLTDERAAQLKNDVIEKPQGAAGVLKELSGPPKITFRDPTQTGYDEAGHVVVQGTPKQENELAKDFVGPDGKPLTFDKASRTFHDPAGAVVTDVRIAPPPVTPAQTETARHNKALEDIAKLTAGRAEAAQAETARHNKAIEATPKLTKVEHRDPTTGKTVIEWLPSDQLRGQTFEKGTSATLDNRLASAQTVTQVGNDLIAKLSDPAFASTVGPIMGRYETLRQFVGNPPPEFSELAGEIESYALANMGVHGMRSYQGAKDISSHLLDRKMTPANLAAAIRGLNSFSVDLLKNEGRSAPSAAPAAMMRAKDPQGNIHEAAAGTALPAGWTLEP
jgi:hypothetical protein